MKLTSKQRDFLRKRAHELDPIVRIGKDGLSDNLIEGFIQGIESRELIKVKILQNSQVEKKEVAFEIAERTNSELVGIIGRTLIFYKENKEEPVISDEVKRI
jgi:RNA-binding protein